MKPPGVALSWQFLSSLWKRRFNDCGPRCLEMVARHHGMEVDLTQLRRWTGWRWSGTNMLNLSRAARQLGFNTLSAQISFDALLRVPLPCIAHLRGNHFVVVQHADHCQVWLADPIEGCWQMPKEQFCAQWKGVVLLLELACQQQ